MTLSYTVPSDTETHLNFAIESRGTPLFMNAVSPPPTSAPLQQPRKRASPPSDGTLNSPPLPPSDGKPSTRRYRPSSVHSVLAMRAHPRRIVADPAPATS